MKSKTFADVSRARSAFEWTHTSYKSGRSCEVILASTSELLAKGAHKLIVCKGEHTIEPINQFNREISKYLLVIELDDLLRLLKLS